MIIDNDFVLVGKHSAVFFMTIPSPPMRKLCSSNVLFSKTIQMSFL